MDQVSAQVKSLPMIEQLEAKAGKQFVFAARAALNMVAQNIVVAQQAEMRDAFDRPTPYTLNSVSVLQRATSSSPSVVVGFRQFAFKGTAAGTYLQPQVAGGSRGYTRFEQMLALSGVLPNGDYATPTNANVRDAYGNVPRGVYSSIASQIRASRDSAQNETARSKKRKSRDPVKGVRYFVGKPAGGRFALGIWARYMFGHGSTIRPVFAFSATPHYEERYPFYDVAEQTVDGTLEPAMQRAFLMALATARW
ncbi:hypothetical protein [Paraburkholderia caribensis]|uniref:hypothetical protein n=1 Tax=Paraburkholderia caribensis TaxID=75105 RepID=UPI000721252C|nr:hypothetical protein [Paraburkholderia caribensis]ALP62812.1 hypothetical protein AN416_09530 [Paraburkholderia caribensis]AUT51957.1 hypothetical protein C2L66_08870 [Paraburkholderia caribensis]